MQWSLAWALLAAGTAGFGIGRLAAPGRSAALAVATGTPIAPRSQEVRAAPQKLSPVRVREPAPDPGGRVAVARFEAPDASRSGAVLAALGPDILAELLRARSSGLLLDSVGLVEILLRAHLDAGDPNGALVVLERYDIQQAFWFHRVGESFEQARDLPQATFCRRTALTLAVEPYGARELLRLDPEAVVEILSRPAPGGPDEGGVELVGLALQQVLAEALIRVNRPGEALLVIEQILAGSPDDETALGLLGQLDPPAAEARLRQLARDDRDWSVGLAEFLVAEGRVQEAGDLLVGLIARGGEENDFRWELSVVDPARGYRVLLDTLSADELDSDASDLWGYTGEELFESGAVEHAVEAWCAAVATTPGDPDEWTEYLAVHAPQRLIAVLERRVSRAPNDEFWGALGDAYWVDGREGAALDAWNRAAWMDPQDTEWREKLAALRAGLDPLD